MKRFKFRFESVEKVRKMREDEALAALGAAQRKLQGEINAKNSLLATLADALLRRENLGREGTSIQAFRTEDAYIQGTKQRIIQADQAILRATRIVEKAMQRYLGARRNKRMIETLRERDQEEFRKAKAKWEQKQSDDMAVMRARLREEAV